MDLKVGSSMVSLDFAEDKFEASRGGRRGGGEGGPHSEWLLLCTAYDGWSWQWWYGAVFVEENAVRRTVL